MTQRGASAAWLSANAAAKNRPFHLVEVRLDAGDGGTVYFTNFHRTIVWNSHTWSAVGYLLDLSGIEESSEMRVSAVALSLSGVDQVQVANALLHQYLDRRVVIYKAFAVESTDAVLVDPVAVFSGPIDGDPLVSEELDGEFQATGRVVVSITASNQFADFQRRSGRRTNLADQQVFFPTDVGLEFVSEVEQQILWGRAA